MGYESSIKYSARHILSLMNRIQKDENDKDPAVQGHVQRDAQSMVRELGHLMDVMRGSSLDDLEDIMSRTREMVEEAKQVSGGTPVVEFYDEWKSHLDGIIYRCFRL